MSWVDEIVDVLFGDVTFDLRIVSWQQLLHGASRSAARQYPNDHRIELKCRLCLQPSGRPIFVSSNPVESLADVEFRLEIRSAERFCESFEESYPASDEFKNGMGILIYNPPSPAEGPIKPLPGSINGWILFGNDSLAKISQILFATPPADISISATVRASSDVTPHRLVFQKDQHRSISSYRWEEGPLEITDAKIVVTPSAILKNSAMLPAPSPESPTVTAIRKLKDRALLLDTKTGIISLFTFIVLVLFLLRSHF